MSDIYWADPVYASNVANYCSQSASTFIQFTTDPTQTHSRNLRLPVADEQRGELFYFRTGTSLILQFYRTALTNRRCSICRAFAKLVVIGRKQTFTRRRV